MEEEERSDATRAYVARLLAHFRTKKLTEIRQSSLHGAYQAVLADGLRASPATKNRAVVTPLRAIMNFAALQEWCDAPKLKGPSITEAPKQFLLPSQATQLVQAAAPHLQPLFIFLIGTGARMSEALELEWKDVDLRARRATVWQKQQTARRIDMPMSVMKALIALPHREGRVFRPIRGRGVGDGYRDTGRQSGGQIKSGWSFACHRAGLPGHRRVWTPKGSAKEKQFFVPDVTPHALRHTWATWHYCVHKDLLRLQMDGAWEKLETVTVYAKLMSDVYRQDIIEWWDSGPEMLGIIGPQIRNES